MTFDAIENSARRGRKVFLYTWQRGEKTWRYTGADRNLQINFQDYIAAAISHEEIEQGPDLVRMNLAVAVPTLHPVAVMYRQQSPIDSVVLTVSEYHAGDPDNEVRPVWSGRIVSVGWDLPEGEATINHSPTSASLGRNGLRRRCQKNCPLVLYGLACRVNREAFRLSTTVAQLVSLALTADGIAGHFDGYWNGGYIEYAIETGVLERRGITSHTSGTITLSSLPIGLTDGMPVSIFPGCDHTTGANGCGKFNNLPNYGGFPHFAQKNPFGNEPVY